ncbi:MAG: 6-bladed beta-propeller [Prevotellaceae bacterium]|jgi:hypothetical protein|nr:6-bladed beta-propeller [Prevotellaceae bacterium]
MKRSSILPIFIIAMFLAFGLTACHEDTSETDFFLIELDKHTHVGEISSTLNEIAESIRVIPVETTDSVLLNSLEIIGTHGNRFICYDQNYVYSLDRTTGKTKILLNQRGQGPKEYINIIDPVLENDTLRFYDSGKSGFLRYTLQGEYVDFLRNDSTTTYYKLPDGNYYMAYPYYIHPVYYTDVYDKNWKLLRHGIPNEHSDLRYNYRFVSIGGLYYNQALFYREYYGDTIYRVSTEADVPYLVLSMGNLKMPPEITTDLLTWNAKQNQYIDGIFFWFASDYCFLYHSYDQKFYCDIWNLNTGKLLYREILERSEYRLGRGTIRCTVNDISIQVTPKYTEGNTAYFEIPPTDVLKLYPNAPEDTNPMILEVKLKEFQK